VENSEVVRGQLRSSQSGSTWLQVNDLYLPMQVGCFFGWEDTQHMANWWFGARWLGILWVPLSNNPFLLGIQGKGCFVFKKNAAGGVVGRVAQQANLMFCLECINASLVWWGCCFSVLLIVVWPYLQKPMAS